MRRFIFATALLTFIGAGDLKPLKAAEINCDSTVWRNHELCKKDEGPVRINSDVNIKGNKKRYVFNELFPATQPPNSQIFYDREYVGKGCNIFGKCLRVGGVIAKWSNYFVELQPYENTTCAKCIGGSRNLTTPPNSIWIKVTDNPMEIRMTNRDKNQYYLPLKLRKQIALNNTELSIEMSGVELSIYKVGDKARPLLNSLVNTTNELKEYIDKSSGKKSKADRLNELKDLLDQGLINQSEYKEGRKKIIND